MTDTFFAPDAETAKHDIVGELYNRLDAVRRAIKAGKPYEDGDEFNLGIDCRLANEELWLEKLIDKIEKS